MEVGGKPFPLTTLKGGINRLRVKGGASPASLYDLLNGFIDLTGAVQQRPGTIRAFTLDGSTEGLCYFDNAFQIFSNDVDAYEPAGTNLNVLIAPTANAAVTINEGAPAVVTWQGSTQTPPVAIPAAGAAIVFNADVGGVLPSPLVEFTTYYVVNPTADSFNLSATPGGSLITTTSVGSGLYTGTVYGSNNPIKTIWFARPFMGFLYVVAEFTSGTIAHYWLQSGGVWAQDTVYQVGAVVTPSVPNGLAYLATRNSVPYPLWTAETLVYPGPTPAETFVEPTVPNGYYYGASNVEGTNPHTGETEPLWPTSLPATVQEYGDYDAANSAQITTPSGFVSLPLSASLTDRYGDSNDIAIGANAAATTAGALSVLPPAALTASVWKGGTTYPQGSVVFPSTNQGAALNAIPNGDFANGDDGSWVFSGSGEQWRISNAGLPYAGAAYELLMPPGATSAYATMATVGLVSPGTSVTASMMLTTGTSGGSQLEVSIGINWYSDTLGSVLISQHDGGGTFSRGGWSPISVTAVAPANAQSCNVYIHAASGTADRDSAGVDLVAWTLESAAPITPLMFEAIQTGAAKSAANEPTWPLVAGETVIDGGVTWQAIGTSVITWEAFPIMQSGADEPVWPLTVGQTVGDGNMSWTAISRQITDPNCPNTKPVCLGASHVFAGDNDIAPYSAAVNPTDWTTAFNAGYLPTGLNNYGANPVAVITLYRGNLIVLNSGGYQMWQIDPDPANMALLDAQPVGSTFTRSAQAIANDTLFLTILGVRNIGTTGATANLQTGMVGQPIDVLVQASLAAATYDPISYYVPARGQYWLVFGPEVFVLTVNGANAVKSWSRYVFPDAITDFTMNGEVMYFRLANDTVQQFDQATLVDDLVSATATISNASPAVFTWDNNALIDGEVAVLATTGVLPAPFVVGAAYYVVNPTTNTFNLALTPGGAAIASTTAGSGTHTVTAYAAWEGVVQWPWLDLSNFGFLKELVGFDMVGQGQVAVQFGWDQTDLSAFTDPYVLAAADVVTGQPIAFPLNSPSISLALTFSPAQQWNLQAVNLYAIPLPSTG